VWATPARAIARSRHSPGVVQAPVGSALFALSTGAALVTGPRHTHLDLGEGDPPTYRGVDIFAGQLTGHYRWPGTCGVWQMGAGMAVGCHRDACPPMAAPRDTECAVAASLGQPRRRGNRGARPQCRRPGTAWRPGKRRHTPGRSAPRDNLAGTTSAPRDNLSAPRQPRRPGTTSAPRDNGRACNSVCNMYMYEKHAG
jgi:hypothetical protein